MKRNHFFQLLAAVCPVLGCFPVWYWFCGWKMLPLSMAYAFLGGNFVLMVVAWLHRRYTMKLEQQSLLLAGLLARGIMLLFGVGSYFLFSQFMNMSGAVTGAIFIGVGYLLYWQILRLPEKALLSVYSLILVCVSYVISTIFCFLQGSASLGRDCFVMLALTAVLFCILKNRLMLSEIASNGRKLPKGFYSHNLKILGLFLLPSAILFLFGERIAHAAGWFLKTVGMWLLHLVHNIALLLFGESFFSEVVATPNYSPTIADNSVLTGIICALVVGGILFLMVKFRGEFLDTIGMVLSHLWDSLRRLIFAKAPVVRTSEQMEYFDSVELLESDTAKIYHAPRKISWKHQYRKFRKLPLSSENYRVGYALWLDALKHWNTDFSERDTPAKILEKSGGIPAPELAKFVTEIYYRVRYGNHIPTKSEWSMLCQLLEEVRKNLS